MLNARLDMPLKDIQSFCKKYPIRKLSLFGSVLREDFRPDSDVDVLVEFEPGAHVSYFDLAGMQIELEAIFGRPVDIGTPDMLRKHMSKQVLENAQVIYESG
jgi:predicted nucleotidyltransferase